ncbi:MAG: PAS domain S-box protein, partial [Myxococcota bacterium]|nr:PAS domain S-box protein [Myxococcota bacterium]
MPEAPRDCIQEAFEFAPTALLMLDRHGHLLAANSRARDFFDKLELGSSFVSVCIRTSEQERAHRLISGCACEPDACVFAFRHRPTARFSVSASPCISGTVLAVHRQTDETASEHRAVERLRPDPLEELTLFDGLSSAQSSVDSQHALASSTSLPLPDRSLLNREVIDCIAAGVLVVDAQSHMIEQVNATAAAMMGRSQEEIVGRVCHRFLCPAELGHCPVKESGQEIDHAVRVLLHASGQELPVLKSVKRVFLGGQPKLLETFVDISDRQGVEQALKKGEENYRRLVEHATVGFATHELVLDASGKPIDYIFLSVNQAFASQSGLPIDDIVGKRISRLMPPADAQFFLERYAPVALEGSSTSFQCHVDTLERDFAITAYAIGPLRFATIFTDITASTRALRELERSREQFELAVRGSNDGIWDWDLRNNSLYLSPKWKEQLGYQDDEIENTFENFAERLHPDDLTRVMNRLNTYLRGESQHYEVDFRLQHKDGAFRWILARGEAVRDDAGLPVRMAGSHTDITERKHAENELLLRNKILRLLTQLSADFITLPLDLVDDAIASSLAELGQLFDADRAYLVDYDFERSLFSNRYEWCAPHIAPRIHELQDVPLSQLGYWVKEHLAGHPIALEDLERLSPTNPIRNYLESLGIRSLLCVPMMDGPACLGFVGFEFDQCGHRYSETEQRLLTVYAQLQVSIRRRQTNERQLRQSREESDRANQAKSAFLANMSHEIRTPMNGVIGMTGLLLDTELNDEQRHYAELVRSSAEALLSLINDILDFSKIEARKLELEILDFDLLALLDDLSSSLAVVAEEKGLELLCSVDAEVPPLLRGDPGRLRQIITNLVSNAIKFTERGEVVIRVERTGDCAEQGFLLRFRVRDTGIGIAPEKHAALFDKFTQVDASTTRQYGGTGLGLAISKQLAQLMGGEIGVDSQLGAGAEFWFTACFEARREDTLPDFFVPVALAGKRALVVDDNHTNREILQARLRQCAMLVEEAEDGATALRLLRQAVDKHEPFELAIIDMQMPEMDGATLGRRIMADPQLRKLRMVMLSSQASRGDAKRFEELGFAGYLTKPVRHDELLAVLRLVGIEDQGPRRIATRHTAKETLLRFEGWKPRILIAEDNITNQQV